MLVDFIEAVEITNKNLQKIKNINYQVFNKLIRIRDGKN